MSRSVVYSLYGLLVLIWSSTWVAIEIGLEDCPPLLGAGVRFTLAGLALLALARSSGARCARLGACRRCWPSRRSRSRYRLVYWGERYVPSGLAAVLFGSCRCYTALLGSVLLHDEPLRAALLVGVLIGIGGLSLAFLESMRAGSGRQGGARASELACAPLGAAVGGIAQKLRAGALSAVVLNGWAMLVGGLLLLAAVGLTESSGDFVWSASRWARSHSWRCSGPR